MFSHSDEKLIITAISKNYSNLALSSIPILSNLKRRQKDQVEESPEEKRHGSRCTKSHAMNNSQKNTGEIVQSRKGLPLPYKHGDPAAVLRTQGAAMAVISYNPSNDKEETGGLAGPSPSRLSLFREF